MSNMSRTRRASQLMHLLTLLLFASRALAQSPPANMSCWNPDPSVQVTGDHPCHDPKTGHSACCTEGAYCMEGGLCWDGFALYRSSCTDPTWQDPACPEICAHFGNKSTAQIISTWHVVPNTFCCGLLDEQNGTCFDSNGAVAPDGFPMQVAPIITSFANASYENLMPWTANASQAASAPAVTTTVAAAAPSPASDAGQLAAVGAGVGVSLGVCLLAALALAAVLWRRVRILRGQLAAARAQGMAMYQPASSAYATWEKNGAYDPPARGAPTPPPKEMGMGRQAVEIGASAPLQELPGTGMKSPVGVRSRG